MTKPRNIITAVLLAFVAASVAFLIIQESTSGAAIPAGEATGQDDQVIAYYFHGKARCVTCQHLEAYAEEALRTGFPRELAAGQLVWRVVDTSLPDNRHFLTDYQLQYQSVVLVEMREGQQQRWQNLDQIWQRVRDKEDYIAYVQGEVDRFLAESPWENRSCGWVPPCGWAY